MRKVFKRFAPHIAATAVLLTVFAAYTRPELLVTLANQVWACF